MVGADLPDDSGACMDAGGMFHACRNQVESEVGTQGWDEMQITASPGAAG